MTSHTSKFKWGAPINIPMPPSGDGELPPWTDLKFNPLGIYNLRRRIGVLAREPGVFTRYQHQFEAADVAWFAAGASEDNNHHIPADSFHHAFDILRADLPSGDEGGKWRKLLRSRLKNILFDLVRRISIPFIMSSVYIRTGYSVGSRLW
jgi:hypothetical protein